MADTNAEDAAVTVMSEEGAEPSATTEGQQAPVETQAEEQQRLTVLYKLLCCVQAHFVLF